MRRNVKTNYYYYRSIDPSFYVRTFKFSELYSIPSLSSLFSQFFTKRCAKKQTARGLYLYLYLRRSRTSPLPEGPQNPSKEKEEEKGDGGGRSKRSVYHGRVYTARRKESERDNHQ